MFLRWSESIGEGEPLADNWAVKWPSSHDLEKKKKKMSSFGILYAHMTKVFSAFKNILSALWILLSFLIKNMLWNQPIIDRNLLMSAEIADPSEIDLVSH